jgi:hypothetical protein
VIDLPIPYNFGFFKINFRFFLFFREDSSGFIQKKCKEIKKILGNLDKKFKGWLKFQALPPQSSFDNRGLRGYDERGNLDIF